MNHSSMTVLFSMRSRGPVVQSGTFKDQTGGLQHTQLGLGFHPGNAMVDDPSESLEDRIEDEEIGMKKRRNLVAELTEGFEALADRRAGKRTLRTHVVQTKATPKMSAKELSALRDRMNLSRALFDIADQRTYS
jgi:hypothetical protein